MYLGVDEDVEVKDYALQVDYHDIGDVSQHTPLGKVAFLAALLTQTVADDLAHMHALQSLLQTIFVLDSHCVVEVLFSSLTLFVAGVAQHLHYGFSLEDGLEEVAVWRLLEFILHVVEQHTQELSGVLLDHGVYGRHEAFQEVLWHVVLPFGVEQKAHHALQLVYDLGFRSLSHHQTVPEWLD